MTDPLLALLPKARRRWARTDPVLARIVREHPPDRRPLGAATGFASLVESIAHQQVSLAAGRTIVKRVRGAAGGRLTPARVLDAGETRLREAGLSRTKAAYVLDLARRAERRDLDFRRLARAPDAEVVEALTGVKGIGVWTAKMFLLFHLHRPDVLPHEDLGLQIAVAHAYGVSRGRAAGKMQDLAPAWSPYASVAALTLWDWRRVVEAPGHQDG